jgi:DNA topoisomerase I
MVRAQETRRILDRLYGYDVSKLLWQKVGPKLSAGRVQSVAVRLIVDRERERMAFHSATIRVLVGTFAPAGANPFEGPWSATRDNASFGQRLRLGHRQIKDPNLLLMDEATAQELASQTQGAVRSKLPRSKTSPSRKNPRRRSPPARCNRKPTANWVSPPAEPCRSRNSCTKTATSPTCVPTRPRSQRGGQRGSNSGAQEYGEKFLHPEERTYANKVKNAQEAHEAIRPAGAPFELPKNLEGKLNSEQFRLFDMIWKRTIACQMADARKRA